MIAVTGASGAVGSRIAARLAERGEFPRLIVRDPAKVLFVESGEADIRQASSYGAAEEMRTALEGVDTLMLIPGRESLDRADQHRTTIDVASDVGVSHVVYLSFIGADSGSRFTLVEDHAETEEYIRASGIEFSFLRMSLYMDFIPGMVGNDGVLRGPADEGRLAAVLRDDVAAAATAVLLDPEAHPSAVYDLTGPATFSLDEAAETMSDLTGLPIRFQNESIEEAYESRAAFGAPEWEVEAWISSYLAISAGELDVISDGVEYLTGESPSSLVEYLESNPDALDHVDA